MLGPTSRAFGQPMPYTFGGKEVVVHGRLQEVYPKIEVEYYKRHVSPLKTCYRDPVDAGWFPDPEERDKLLRLAVAQADEEQGATGQKILDWLGTIDGDAFYGSLCLKAAPKEGEKLDDLPFLTEQEMKKLIVAEMDATIRRNLDRAEDAEKMAAEAENMALAKLHDMLNMASGTDLLGKGTGPSSGAGSGDEDDGTKTRSP